MCWRGQTVRHLFCNQRIGGSIPSASSIYGGLAQLGEHLLCKQDVIGSIPISSTIYREVSEWLKELAWKAGVGNTTEGSNPSLSATFSITT